MAIEDGLARLNALPRETLLMELLSVCGSKQWSENVAAAAPFACASGLHAVSNCEWWRLTPEGWLEAFLAHPRIGDRAALAAKFAKPTQESQEQAGAAVIRSPAVSCDDSNPENRP